MLRFPGKLDDIDLSFVVHCTRHLVRKEDKTRNNAIPGSDRAYSQVSLPKMPTHSDTARHQQEDLRSHDSEHGD